MGSNVTETLPHCWMKRGAQTTRFELQHRRFGKLNVATKIMGIENGLDVLQRVAGDGGDLRYARARDRQVHRHELTMLSPVRLIPMPRHQK